MCEALRELMKDEMEEELKKAKVEGKAEGIKETLISMVRDGILTVKDAAKRADLSETAFRKLLVSK